MKIIFVATMDDTNERLIKKKMEWAREKRGQNSDGREEGFSVRQNPSATDGERPRLPPGQRMTRGFPVLDLGIQPEIQIERWSLEVGGLVDRPRVWDWSDFMALPQSERVTDFHCVTTWSTFDNTWTGVLFRKIIEEVRPRPEAKHVLFTAYDGYTTNVPLAVLDDDDVLIAHRWNGLPLTREHGGPVRMIIPKLYAWKGAKWVKEMAFLAEDRPGYWEVRGYSNTADPWMEDRYS